MDSCNTTETLKFISSDRDFSVVEGGIFALCSTVVPLTGRRFSVRAQDDSGHTNIMEVNLLRQPSAAPTRLVCFFLIIIIKFKTLHDSGVEVTGGCIIVLKCCKGFLLYQFVSMVRLSQVERRIRRFLKRAKRVWRPPPFNIVENGKGPFPKVLDHVIILISHWLITCR